MWGWALAGGLLGSGLTLYVLGKGKARSLEARARQWQAPGGQVAEIQARLTARAQQLAPQIAEQVGETYLARVYGLTPQRLEAISDLARRLGV